MATVDIIQTAHVLAIEEDERNPEPCVDCGKPVAWIEELGDYYHLDPEHTCWLHQKPLP